MTDTQSKADVVWLAQAAQEALTDTMIERLSVTGANAMEVIDRLNDEETRDAVMFLIDKITDLHRIGALGTLFEAVTMLHGARSALTDNMIERLFIFVEHMINNLANEEVAAMTHNARMSMDEAVDMIRSQPESSGGLVSTLKMLSRPESGRALQFLLAFACKMQAHSVGVRDEPVIGGGE
jgi:uncharacterized protein YjgD (DUF1641 family)